MYDHAALFHSLVISVLRYSLISAVCTNVKNYLQNLRDSSQFYINRVTSLFCFFFSKSASVRFEAL